MYGVCIGRPKFNKTPVLKGMVFTLLGKLVNFSNSSEFF